MRANQLKRSVFRSKDNWLHHCLQSAGRPGGGHSTASGLAEGRKAAILRGLPHPFFAYLHTLASRSARRYDESLCHLHKNNRRILP